MTVRKITKKIRFEVFKRDGFQCVYCGKTPPEVILEVDHIEPVSKGGTDDLNNLVTACFDCNRGKGKIRLERIPSKLSENLEVLKIEHEQIKEFNKYVRLLEKQRLRSIRKVENVLANTYEGYAFSTIFINVSMKRFCETLNLLELVDAMTIACFKCDDNPQDTIKYFCGICWTKIRAKIGGAI